MEQIKSHLDFENAELKEKKKNYLSLMLEYRSKIHTLNNRKDKAVVKHLSRGKKLVRERIDLLLDFNSPFLEFSGFAAYDQYNNDFPYAGIVTGIGYIHGREVVIIANDATIKGGTYVKETIKKHLRSQKIALQNNLPCVYLVDSGGVYLPEQANVFPDKDDFGRIFYNQAKLSSKGVPQISIVLGSCTAGGAYIPAMSDESIIVKGQGTIFLGGPPLVKAATGESVSDEELGGGEIHASQSGVADHLAENEEHAFNICRDIFRTLPDPIRQPIKIEKSEEPSYTIDELYSILPLSPKEVIDAHEIISRLVDKSEFHEFKKNYGKSLVTGFARIMGYNVGIMASNGILYSESALKGTHFIELCNFRKTPLIFLQNINGFMVGKRYENMGIAKDGAKLVHAVAMSNVPKITLVFGGSYGAGNYAMAGRAFEPNFLFMYPNSRISVMGGEQAATVMSMVKKDQLEKVGKSMSEEKLNELKKPIVELYERESSAYFSSSNLWDDGIIDPADTRKVLAIAISATLNKIFPEPKSGVYRM